jgi:hypothetical protein
MRSVFTPLLQIWSHIVTPTATFGKWEVVSHVAIPTVNEPPVTLVAGDTGWLSLNPSRSCHPRRPSKRDWGFVFDCVHKTPSNSPWVTQVVSYNTLF